MVYARRRRSRGRRRSRKVGAKTFRRYKAKRWKRRLRYRKRGGKYNTNRTTKNVALYTRGIKHNLSMHRPKALIRTQFNCCWHRYDLDNTGGFLGLYWQGYPYFHSKLMFRMNDVYDPSIAVLDRWQKGAGYHKALSTVYQEYRVLSSKITVTIRNIGLDVPTYPSGATFTMDERMKAAYYAPMIVSMIRDDDGNLPSHVQNMMQWPAQRFQDRVKQMRHDFDINSTSASVMKWYWTLPYDAKKDGSTWAAVNASPPSAGNKGLPYILIAFQRMDYSGVAFEPAGHIPAFPPITVHVKITPIVEYRYPKDFSDDVWHAHDVGTPEEIGIPVEELNLEEEITVTPTPLPTPEPTEPK